MPMRLPHLRRLAAALPLFAPALAAAQGAVNASLPPLASFDSAWAAITRTYWDQALLDGRWKVVRDSLRTSLGDEATPADVRRAVRALIAVPRQSHFVLLPGDAAPAAGRAAREPGTAGVEVRPLDGTIIAWRIATGSVAALAGIKPGDRIVQVDSFPLDSMQRVLRGSAPDATVGDHLLASFVAARLAGGLGEEVRVDLVDASGRRRSLLLERSEIEGQLTRFGNLPPFAVHVSTTRLPVTADDARTIAVVRFNGWFPALSTALDSAFFGSRDAAGLIIDLRGNPGGVVGMIAGISGHMLDTVVSLGELRQRSSVLRFSANPRRVDPAGNRTAPFAGPIAILVDDFSASTSEFFASGMQALGRARVFGSRSAGMALPAAAIRLPSGDVMMHVIADHMDPKGRRVEGVGIEPDVLTPLRLEDLRAGRDAALEAARAWIASGAH